MAGSSCDFVGQDLGAARDLLGAGPHGSFTAVWVSCTLTFANEEAGVSGQPFGLLGFQPRRVIPAGHAVLVEPDCFRGKLQSRTGEGYLDTLEVTIAGPPLVDPGDGELSVTIEVLSLADAPLRHRFNLSSLTCDAEQRTLHGVGDVLSGPGGVGIYTFQISSLQHHHFLPPGS
jgi:hypothetical protein